MPESANNRRPFETPYFKSLVAKRDIDRIYNEFIDTEQLSNDEIYSLVNELNKDDYQPKPEVPFKEGFGDYLAGVKANFKDVSVGDVIKDVAFPFVPRGIPFKEDISAPTAKAVVGALGTALDPLDRALKGAVQWGGGKFIKGEMKDIGAKYSAGELEPEEYNVLAQSYADSLERNFKPDSIGQILSASGRGDPLEMMGKDFAEKNPKASMAIDLATSVLNPISPLIYSGYKGAKAVPQIAREVRDVNRFKKAQDLFEKIRTFENLRAQESARLFPTAEDVGGITPTNPYSHLEDLLPGELWQSREVEIPSGFRGRVSAPETPKSPGVTGEDVALLNVLRDRREGVPSPLYPVKPEVKEIITLPSYSGPRSIDDQISLERLLRGEDVLPAVDINIPQAPLPSSSRIILKQPTRAAVSGYTPEVRPSGVINLNAPVPEESLSNALKKLIGNERGTLDLRKSPELSDIQINELNKKELSSLLDKSGISQSEFEDLLKSSRQDIGGDSNMFDVAESMGKSVKPKGVPQSLSKIYHDNFGDVGKQVSKVKGGGDIYQLGERQHGYKMELEDAGRTIMESGMNGLRELRDTDPYRYKMASQRVFSALEDRANASKYLRTDAERQAYNSALKFYDMYRGEMQKAGLKTLDDYATHIRSVFEDSKVEPELSRGVPREVRSVYSAMRKGNGAFDDADLLSTMGKYQSSMARMLAYDPVVKKYYAGVDKGIVGREAVLKNFVEKLITPTEDKAGDLVNFIARNRYNTIVRANPFSAIENLTQRHYSSADISDDAARLSKAVLKNADELGLSDFLNGNIMAKFEDLPHSEGPIGRAVDKVAFQATERGNWVDARAKGVAQQIVDHPKYRELRKAGKSDKAILEELLDTPAESRVPGGVAEGTTRERAMQYGQNLASRNQFFSGEGFRPEVYEKASKNAWKLVAQFKRFSTSMPEVVMDKLTRAGRESNIRRRGFADEASVVDRLEAMRNQKKGFELMKKQTPAETKDIDRVISELDNDIKELNRLVDMIEPSRKVKTIWELSKGGVKGLSVNMLKNWAKWSIAAGLGAELTDKDKDVDTKRAVLRAVPAVGGVDTLGDLLLDGGYPKDAAAIGIDLLQMTTPAGYTKLIPGDPLGKMAKKRFRKSIKNWGEENIPQSLDDLL